MSVNLLLKYPPGSWEQFWARSWSASEFLNTEGITTSHRDGLIATDGMIIYNSDNNAIEGFINGTWQSLATASQIPPIAPNSCFYCFSGSPINLTDSVGVDMLFNNVIYNHNNNISNTSGNTIYTAPVNGIYNFSFSCQVNTFVNGINTQLSISLQASSPLSGANFAALGPSTDITSTEVYNLAGSVSILLNAGSTVRIFAAIYGGSCTLPSGALLSGCLVRQI